MKSVMHGMAEAIYQLLSAPDVDKKKVDAGGVQTCGVSIGGIPVTLTFNGGQDIYFRTGANEYFISVSRKF